jgi:hypothetical protein
MEQHPPEEGRLADLANPSQIVPAARTPLITAIAEAMADAGEVTKSSVNKDQGYKFASAEAILAAVRKPLLTRGVLLIAHPFQYFSDEIVSRNGAKGEKIVIDVDFTFRNGDGEELTIRRWRGIGQDYGDKAIGKAYTNAVKTFVRTEWLLPTEHDDPESSSPGESVAERTALPAWALEASPESKAGMVQTLGILLGEEEARALGVQIRTAFGVVPAIVPMAVNAIITKYLRSDPTELLERRDALERENQTEQEAAPDMPPDEDEPDYSPGLEIEPGSITVTDLPTDPAKAFGVLRAAGCTCEDPLCIKNPTGVFSDTCPIEGHAIPF